MPGAATTAYLVMTICTGAMGTRCPEYPQQSYQGPQAYTECMAQKAQLDRQLNPKLRRTVDFQCAPALSDGEEPDTVGLEP